MLQEEGLYVIENQDTLQFLLHDMILYILCDYLISV